MANTDVIPLDRVREMSLQECYDAMLLATARFAMQVPDPSAIPNKSFGELVRDEVQPTRALLERTMSTMNISVEDALELSLGTIRGHEHEGVVMLYLKTAAHPIIEGQRETT